MQSPRSLRRWLLLSRLRFDDYAEKGGNTLVTSDVVLLITQIVLRFGAVYLDP